MAKRQVKPELLTGTPEDPDIRLVEDYAIATDRSRPFGQRIRAFFSGQNRAGRIAGSILDAATILLPFGQQIQTGREAASLVLQRKNKPPMKELLKRTLGTGGGSFITVRNENNEIDVTTIAASTIRVLLIIAVLWVAKMAGVLDVFTSLVGL